MVLTTAKKQSQSKWLTGSYRCVLHRYEEETSRKKEPNHGTKECSPVGINRCGCDYGHGACRLRQQVGHHR